MEITDQRHRMNSSIPASSLNLQSQDKLPILNYSKQPRSFIPRWLRRSIVFIGIFIIILLLAARHGMVLKDVTYSMATQTINCPTTKAAQQLAAEINSREFQSEFIHNCDTEVSGYKIETTQDQAVIYINFSFEGWSYCVYTPASGFTHFSNAQSDGLNQEVANTMKNQLRRHAQKNGSQLFER